MLNLYLHLTERVLLYKLLQLGLFLLAGVIVSYLTNVFLLNYTKRVGFQNKNDITIRWSAQSKPSLGGISLFVVFVLISAVYNILYVDEPLYLNIQFVGLFVAAIFAFLMGLADDAYNTKPKIKLGVQIACGITFVLSGTIIDLTHNFWIDSILTIIWVIGIMNSLNMLDNMDGITATTVVFILLACLFSFYLVFDVNRNIWSILIASQIGALIGFLRLNVHPSKLFMGDAGSQFIGLFVAFFSINHLWNIGKDIGSPSWVGLLVCLIAFTPAAVDTFTVVINRLRRGQSPMVGGKDHTTHHLVYAGFNDKQVWFVFLFIGFISFVLSTGMVYLSKLGMYTWIAILSLYFLIVFVFLYRLTIKYNQYKAKKKNETTP